MNKFSVNDITIHVYETLSEFINSEEKPFGDLPKLDTEENFIEFYKETAGDMKCNAWVSPTGMHIFAEKDCDDEELIFTIGHELGHLQPRLRKNINEEKRADTYGVFANEVFVIFNAIKQIKDE
jgi:hypothetical protein